MNNSISLISHSPAPRDLYIHGLVDGLRNTSSKWYRIKTLLCTGSYQTSINSLTHQQLHQFVYEVAKRTFLEGSTVLMERAFNVISLSKILEAASITEVQLNHTIRCLEICENELQRGAAFISDQDLWKKEKSQIVRKIYGLIETLLSALSYVEAGKEPASSWEASHILQVYGQVLAIPFVLIIIFNSLLSSPLAAIAATAITIGIIVGVIFIYIKWLRPPRESHSGFRNLNTIEGQKIAVLGRHDEIDQADFYLSSGLNVTFLGPPGVGKSTLIYGVSQRQNDRELGQRRSVFAGNSSLLQGNGFSSDSTERFLRFQSFVEHAKQPIICGFDEMEALVKPSPVSEVFKSATDKSIGSFKSCMGAMTHEDYNKYIATDAAWIRRFPVVIPVKPTRKKQTIEILRDLQSREFADITISDEVLEQIYKGSKNYFKEHAQPDISIIIFCRSVAAMRMAQWNTETRSNLRTLRAHLGKACRAFLEVSESQKAQEIGKDIEDLNTKIKGLETSLKDEITNTLSLSRLKKKKENVKSEICHLATQILKLKMPNDPKRIQLKKKMVFLKYFLQPYLDNEIQDSRVSSPIIDETLVNSVIKNAIEQHKKHTLVPDERKGHD